VDAATRQIYETRTADYEAGRSPRWLAEADALAARVPDGPIVDLGCGPGWYTGHLGPHPIALDGALAMVRRTREVVPDAPGLQADLLALPFRRGSVAGGWARNTYVHLRSTDVPMALADLHRTLRPDAPIEVTFFGGDAEGRGIFEGDDFPGRWFSTWTAERLREVVLGAGFELDELEEKRNADGDELLVVRARRAQLLPDHVRGGMRLLVCGLNPSVHAAEAGVGYVTPGNRFWPAALEADLVTRDRDPLHALRAHGMGMTDLVKRATPRADVLTREEYAAGVARLDRLCAWLQPGTVAVVGLAGWRAAVDRKAVAGEQPTRLGGRPVYVLPSTSGLNAATPLRVIVEHLRAAADLADRGA
jgi:TDG/mug DNA glycosylase family protein